MKILPVFNYYIQTKPLARQRVKFNALNKDTVCFTGKKPKSTHDRIKEAPKDCFPSTGLRDYLLEESEKPENKDKGIIDLHKEYYALILDCTSLKEAKDNYPELEKVIDIKDTPYTKRSILTKVQNGEIEGITLDNITLELLKRNYALLLPVVTGNNPDYFNLDKGIVDNLLNRANLRCDKRYKDLITADRSKNITKSRWEDEEEREKLLTSLRTDEIRQLRSAYAKKYYENESARAAFGDRIRELWQDPVYREKMLEIAQSEERREYLSELQTALWKDPIYREKMLASMNTDEAQTAKREKMTALWENPEFKEKMAASFRRRKTKGTLTPEHRAKIKASLQSEEIKKASSERSKALWQDEEYREKMEIVHKASSEAWKRHPECTKAYSEVAKEFPMLKIFLIKEHSNQKLTEGEKNYIQQYFRRCSELYPEIQKIIGEEQKRILQEWDFYN